MSYLNTLRRRFADSPKVQQTTARRIARYVDWAQRTSTWQDHGLAEMMNVVRGGNPVIFVIWHQRLIMTPSLFDIAAGPFSTLTSAARAGRMAGMVLGQSGFDTIPMSSHQRHVALSREVLRRMQAGHSIGIAADGPRGPHRQSSTVPLIWARMTGARVFCASFAHSRPIKLPTWDKMMLPTPYGRGVLRVQEWGEVVPKRASDTQTEALRKSLEATLDAVTDACDADLSA